MSRVLTALAIVALPTPVWAHGPAPTPLRVLSADGGTPRAVLTNIGMAADRVDDDLYDYVCPATWGGLETPLTTVGGDVVFVLGADDLYWSVDVACGFERSRIGVVDPATVVALAASPHEGVVMATDGPERTTMAWGDLTDGASLQTGSLPGRVDGALWTGEGFLATGARPALTVHRIVAGQAESWEPQAPTASPQRLSPRYVAGSRVYFSAVTDGGVELWSSDDGGRTLDAVLTGELSLHGPATWCGGIVAVVDGVLVADPAHPPACDLGAFSGRRFQCLHEAGGTPFTCENRILYRLTDAGTDPAWDLGLLRGPDCLADECGQDWLHYGAEAGLVGLDMPDAGTRDVGTGDAGTDAEDPVAPVDDLPLPPPTEPDCTCSIAAASSHWYLRRR